jgi:hypothetical protein
MWEDGPPKMLCVRPAPTDVEAGGTSCGPPVCLPEPCLVTEGSPLACPLERLASPVPEPEALQAGASSGGSSGTSFGATVLHPKTGLPLSPSSPLSEWRG